MTKQTKNAEVEKQAQPVATEAPAEQSAPQVVAEPTATAEAVAPTQPIVLAPAKKSNGLVIGLLVFLGVVVVTLVVGTIVAASSPTRIPIFSDIAALFQTEQQKQKNIGQDIVARILSNPAVQQYAPEAVEAAEKQGLKPLMDKYSSEDINIPVKIDMTMSMSSKGTDVDYLTGKTKTEKNEIELAISGYTDGENSDLDMEISMDMGGMAITMEAKYMMVDEVAYIKITSFPDLGTGTLPIVDKWIKLTPEEVEQFTSGFTQGLEEDTKGIEVDEQMSNQMGAIIDFLTSAEFTSAIKTRPDKTIDGVANTCMAFAPSNDELEAMLRKLNEIQENMDQEGMTQKEITEAVDSVKKLEINFCMSKDKGLPYEIDGVIESEAEDSSTDLAFTIEYSEYGVKENVKAPTGDMMTMTELMMMFMGSNTNPYDQDIDYDLNDYDMDDYDLEGYDLDDFELDF